DCDLWALLTPIGIQLAIDHFAQARPRPLRFQEQVVSALQSLQPLAKLRSHIRRGLIRRFANAGMDERVHYGESILHAMIELADQHGLAPCCEFSFGDVAKADDESSGRAAKTAIDYPAARAAKTADSRNRIFNRQFISVAPQQQHPGPAATITFIVLKP